MAVYTGGKVEQGKRTVTRTIVLRCELDALRSSSGVAHLCGHDGHMAIMCGLATLLVAHRAELAINTILLFQVGLWGIFAARALLSERVSFA